MSNIPPSEDAASALEQLEDAARKLGLYLDRAMWVPTPGGPPALVVDFLIGDVAWSPRVQDPDQAAADTAFSQIAVEETKTDFDDLAERIRRNIAAGRSPFDQEGD